MLLDAQLSLFVGRSLMGRGKFFNLRYTACPNMYVHVHVRACVVVPSTLETPCKSNANSLVKKNICEQRVLRGEIYTSGKLPGPKCFETRPFIRTTVETQLYATARKYVEEFVYETHGE